jgi:hypothetical protein
MLIYSALFCKMLRHKLDIANGSLKNNRSDVKVINNSRDKGNELKTLYATNFYNCYLVLFKL